MAKAQPHEHSVVFHEYPKLIFAYPIIIIGVLFWLIAGAEPSQGLSEVLGWVYLLATLLVLITLGLDVERNHAVFWFVVFLLFYFLGRWLEDAKGFTFFGDIYEFFAGLDVSYNRSYGLVVSIFLSLPYAVMLIWARLQDKWRITHNEFEHYSFGRADDSLARGAKRVRTTYPDLLELLLLGAGTLVVYSATGRTELRRIHHVPLLPLLRQRINRILETTAVTSAAGFEAEVIEEEVTSDEAEHAPGDESGAIGGEKL